jgi:AraC family transcriptional regulator of adaptative response/methylated-DNA-[protein]-cysteine methyltransferase
MTLSTTSIQTAGNGLSDGPDAAIRYAVGRCWLGRLLVARGAAGVCAILIGDDPAALVRDLGRRFPAARPVRAEAELAALVAEVADFAADPRRGLGAALDARGTAFQRRVWQALRDIPAGATASYGEVAARIGRPGAVRAVAAACAANPVAIAVPCHRVVRADGGLSGYRWGVDRKRALLDREAAA